jgi:hypothetical protein
MVKYDGSVSKFPQYVHDLWLAIRPYYHHAYNLLDLVRQGSTVGFPHSDNHLLHQAVANSTLPLHYRHYLSDHPDEGLAVLKALVKALKLTGSYTECISQQQGILMAVYNSRQSPSAWIQSRRRARIVLQQFATQLHRNLIVNIFSKVYLAIRRYIHCMPWHQFRQEMP